MVDASHCKVHPHATGARGGNQDMSRTKGGSAQNCIWLWIRMVCRSGLITQGTTADCTQATALIDGFSSRYLLEDHGYDSNNFID